MMDAQLLTSSSLSPVRSRVPDPVGARYPMYVQDERWKLDAKGEVTVRVSEPRESWSIDYSACNESWGACGQFPAFDRSGNVARIYGGGTAIGHKQLVGKLRAEGVTDFGGTDRAYY